MVNVRTVLDILSVTATLLSLSRGAVVSRNSGVDSRGQLSQRIEDSMSMVCVCLLLVHVRYSPI